MEQEALEELLKKKGIGPEGSKSLKKEELDKLETLLHSPSVSLTTKATMLTALLTLDPTNTEHEWIEKIKQTPATYLPTELIGYFTASGNEFLRLIRKVIEHNELSQDEALKCMQNVIDKTTPEYLKASFLEAERLKRETSEENKTFFNFLYNQSLRIETKIFPLIDICDNYDGSNRSYNFSLFTATVLAASGFRVVLHGIDNVAPKQGITSHQILNTANKNPFITLQKALENIENSEIRWAYLDQSVYFPQLYELKNMRKEMVKRPFLATFEKLLQPIHSSKGNLIVTGFTHPHYKQEVVNQIKNQGKADKAIVLKGVEGSTHMSLSKDTTCVVFDGISISETKVNPSDFNIPIQEQKQDRSLTTEDSYEQGLKALEGEKNYARENIIYLGAVILNQFDLYSKTEIIPLLTQAIDSGKALNHWLKGNQ